MGIPETNTISQLSLPPGFRFYPTDEELLVQYLCRKVAGQPFSLQIIADIDLYKFDPWDLPSKAVFGEKEWYFFSPRDRKYPNGSRPNRVAGSGYWKATGTDKIITTDGRKVGIKKSLVFYIGKAPKGTKTNWIMHEYRLSESTRKNGSSRLDDWVLCRIYKKSSGAQKPAVSGIPRKEYSSIETSSSSSSQYDSVLESFPDVDERFFSFPKMKYEPEDHKLNLQQLGSGNFDWATLAGINQIPELGNPTQPQQMNCSSMSCQNDVFAPPLHHFGNANVVDEEVQSGIRAQRADRPGFFAQSMGLLGQGFSNTVDPLATQGRTQLGGFGYRAS